MTLDTSVYPYFDNSVDANSKNYHKILFVPGNAVQARELTQIQSILQEQIKRNGDHLFKNGTVIIPGHLFYDNKVVSLQVSNSYGTTTLSSIGTSLIGLTLVGTSGVSVYVKHYEPATATDPAILFVIYTSSNGVINYVSPGEVLTSSDLNASVQIMPATTSVGNGSLVSISPGVFYVNGYYVGVAAQTIALDKYTSTPSNVVGLTFQENIVQASSDATLYDNALGFPNYAAQGADRYQIQLVLTKKNSDYTDIAGQALISFVSLLRVVNGEIQYLLENTEYAQIEKMLARRTYDEAGDYIVKDFKIKAKNKRSNSRGQWVTSTPYIIGDVVTNAGNFYTAKNSGYSGSTAPSQLYGDSTDGGIYWLQTSLPYFNSGVSVTVSNVLQDHINDEQLLLIQTSPGKAYINGFEVNIQDRRTTTVSKARDFDQKTAIQIYNPVGSFAQITNVTGVIDTSTMTQVNLLDPGAVVRGTAWATTLEYVSGTPGTTTSVYNLYLFNVKLNSGFNLKNDILTVASTSGTTFSATFVQTLSVLSGIVSTTATSAVVTGKGTLFTQEVGINDQIQIGGVTKVVLSVTNDISLTTTTAWAATSTDVPVSSLIVPFSNSGNYISPLPNTFMRNIKAADGSTDISYTVEKTVSFAAASTSYAYTLTITGETFIGVAGHIVVNTATNAIVNATYTLNGPATILTIGGLVGGQSYKVIALVKRSGSAALIKSKTIATKTIIVNTANITDDLGNVLSTSYNFSSAVISATTCDVQRIIKVTMSGADGAYNATGESDVTAWFTLKSNNKLSHYAISTINRNPGIVSPSRALKITYEYFQHSSGDFFSVDSYSSIPYTKIPTENHSGIIYNLRDCLDFRSRSSDDGLSFNGTGGAVSTPLYFNSTISTSYSYYLPRIDVITLNESGVFEYFAGKSALSPKNPVVTDRSLDLAVIYLDPYSITPETVYIKPTQHRRYTMSDIKTLDTRLSNVEQYVALNQLEKKTSTLQIYDINGLSRYKNGFIADPFTSFDVADISAPDFNCSIDFTTNIMRPAFFSEKVPLVEPAGTTDSSRLSAGYQVTGDWITLPYVETPLISQLVATRTENINPFAVFSWNGSVKLTPEKDTWLDNVVNKTYVNLVGETITTNTVSYTYVSYVWGDWNYGRSGVLTMRIFYGYPPGHHFH